MKVLLNEYFQLYSNQLQVSLVLLYLSVIALIHWSKVPRHEGTIDELL